jgi:hypothetical protein
MSVPIAIPPAPRRFFDETVLTTNIRGRMGDAIGRGEEIGAPNLEQPVRKPKPASLTAAMSTRYAPTPLDKPSTERAFVPTITGATTAATVRQERLLRYPNGWIERPDGSVADMRSMSAKTEKGIWSVPRLPSETIVVPGPFTTKDTVPGEATRSKIQGVQTF